MDDGEAVRVLRGEEIGADRLAHGYAVTVHRSQGATVERTHALEDGGGRELAYVKMSRATDRSNVYVVADSVEQAVEDLCREWKVEHRLTWVIDRSPATGRNPASPGHDVDAALRRGELLAERHAILAAVAADPTAAIRDAERELDGLRRRRADLETGRGRYANHPLNRAVLVHDRAEENITRLQANLTSRRLPRRERREKEQELGRWRIRAAATAKTLADIRAPEKRQLDRRERKLSVELARLYGQRSDRAAWFAAHPAAVSRLDDIEGEVETLTVGADRFGAENSLGRGASRNWPWLREAPVVDRGLDHGIGR